MAAKLKTESVRLRLTPMEKAKLQGLADLAQKSQSEYIRWLIERESLKPK